VKPKGFGWRLSQERRLKACNEGRDILKRDVAKAVGASESAVGRWESKGAIPDDYVLIQLATYFGVTPAWLRYGQEPREAPAPRSTTREPDPHLREAEETEKARVHVVGRKSRR
jgi:transcriptional regulator with XRE-family HTH domain